MEVLVGEIEGFAGALTLTVLLLAPPLGVILFVGLTVSILQAATQIQEQTLSFVPKLGAFSIMVYFGGRWMLGQLAAYLTLALDSLPEISRAVGS